MKNWTIGKRLAAGFSALMIVILCLGGITWLKMGSIKQNVELISHEHLPQLKVAESMRYQVAMLRITNYKHVMYDAATKKDLDKQAQEEETALAGFVSKYEKLALFPEEKALAAKLSPLLQSYRAETQKLREASTQNKAEATQAFLLSVGKVGNQFIELVEEIVALTFKETDLEGKTIAASAASAKLAVIVVSVLAIVLSIAVGFLITRSISSILRRLVSELTAGADQTASAASQVSETSQSLAEGTSEQAASIEETGASLEELASMTKRNAENSHKANELAKQTRAAADKGVGDMQAMSAAMESIKTSSDDIAKIIKTIDEIAFQTNILALNAAVEAARAGEAGMGFAVVADEVRNLAQRSAQAAKETASKIEGAIGNTAQGVDLSTKVAAALNDIVTRARQVDELAAEVANASREQTQGISQINAAVGQMDKATQANAASAEETAASAEELNAQAEVMKQSVAELMQLVGGSGATSGAIRAGATSPSAHLRRPSSNSHGSRPAANVKPARPEPSFTPAPAEVASRRSEIPMAGDFKDF